MDQDLVLEHHRLLVRLHQCHKPEVVVAMSMLQVQLPSPFGGLGCLVVLHGGAGILLGSPGNSVCRRQAEGLLDDVRPSWIHPVPDVILLDLQLLQDWHPGPDHS